MSLAQEIKEYGLELGLDEVKITTAANLTEAKEFMEARKENGELSKFVKDDLDLITSPRQVLPNAQSVIVVAVSYYCSTDESRTGLRGKLSRFTQGQDYHQVLGAKLKKLADFLKTKEQDVETYSFVDTGATVDRALAKRAGLGWQGKNCSIIHPEYGSWIFIGGIITNLELEFDSPLEEKCGDCTKCLDACPTGALEEEYLLNAAKCLGQVTLTKGYLDEQERKDIGVRIWGCDTCQEVCPYNQEVTETAHPEFCQDGLGRYPELVPLLKLTNQQFKDKFGDTVMNWRGKRPIKRNAAVVLGNLQKEAAVAALLQTLKEDPQAIVRGHAAWALGEIYSLEAQQGLKAALKKEEDKQVRKEIKIALKGKDTKDQS
ncbi:MAG: tRNA epoxyqueuosine(34) reductase QueG [Bacillota bacterium]